MNRFTVDFSSSPSSEGLPSNSPQQQRRNVFSLPDDVASTTPAAPPPSQLFGSSQATSGVSKLRFPQSSQVQGSSTAKPQSVQKGMNVASAQSKSRLFEMSTNTYASQDDREDSEDEMMDEGTDNQEYSRDFQYSRNAAPALLKFSTNSMQRSTHQTRPRRTQGPNRSALPRKGRSEIIPGIAKDLAKRLEVASLTESDEIILETENIIRHFDEECQGHDNSASHHAIATSAAQELLSRWRRRVRHPTSLTAQNVIGPDAKSNPFEKAQFLAALLLGLRHPQESSTGTGIMAFGESRNMRKFKAMPEVLLEWLDSHHINYEPLFQQVINTTPSPSANELYWDAIESFTLRGKFEEVMELLKKGDLNYAVIDTPDGTQEAKFSGTQLQQAEDAIYRARQMINSCPVWQSNDWDLDGPDWSVYRKQLEAEIDYLASQVNSHDEAQAEEDANLGLFSKPAAKSGLPFVIYQRLKTVYGIMLGDANDVIGLAQDWVEASILLTVWWVPVNEKNVAQWSFDVSRANNQNVEDINPHLHRLSDAFLCVTDPSSDSGFQLNNLDAVEVGVGAVFQGDIPSCLRILQSLSLCAASSTAEIGTWAGWLNTASPSTGFDQDDLMVLNYGSTDTTIKKDDILENYARALFDRDMVSVPGFQEVEGWELAFSILNRLDDQEQMHESISELLHKIPITDQARTAKLVNICEQFGLESEGRKVSESFADNLVNNTADYGTALLCYARAHAEHKVRQLIDLLNSYCLVQSKAYPAEDEMDAALSHLVSNPKSALRSVAEADPHAAEILQFYLVGYACLRRFYSLRDDHLERDTQLQLLARKKAAAKALIAAINSAADSIYGGLYDTERQSAIQVDGLLTMLGEATAFFDQQNSRRVLSCEQLYALLAAVEDLSTVSDRVYRAAEECMEASLRNYHGSLPPSPRAMLKKSVSSGTNSNFSFSMMGSEMLARSEESLGANSLGSAVMIGKRGNQEPDRVWDWRASFKDAGTTGNTVVSHLRRCIAKELSIATIEESSLYP